MTTPTIIRPSTSAGKGSHPSPDGRRSRPTRRPRLTRGQRWTAVGLVLVLAIAGGWLVGFSSVLDTRSVAVSGHRLLSEDEVLGAAAVPLGTPLARQDTAAVAARVAALRPVESVRVERRWPHTLAVTVVERVALLAVPTPDGVVLVDRTGTGFAAVPSAPSGVPRAELDLSDPAVVSAAAAVSAALTADLAARVTRIEAKHPGALTLIVDGKIPVMWGTPAESELKASIVAALLKRKPKAMDVSAPHAPAIR